MFILRYNIAIRYEIKFTSADLYQPEDSIGRYIYNVCVWLYTKHKVNLLKHSGLD